MEGNMCALFVLLCAKIIADGSSQDKSTTFYRTNKHGVISTAYNGMFFILSNNGKYKTECGIICLRSDDKCASFEIWTTKIGACLLRTTTDFWYKDGNWKDVIAGRRKTPRNYNGTGTHSGVTFALFTGNERNFCDVTTVVNYGMVSQYGTL
jgi:hypothetical protein